PQVSIHFASQEVFGLMAMLDRERQHQVGLPGLAAVIRLMGRDRQLEMDADIHDDPHGAKGLGPQHAQLVVGILQVAELAHQALGVERPSLSAARYRRRQALKATELGRTVGELCQLKMMSWYPLVIGGRDLAPQW